MDSDLDDCTVKGVHIMLWKGTHMKPTIRTVVKDDKRVIRWEHLKPLECTCCSRVATYRIYVPDKDARIGARMVHLCDTHYEEVRKLHPVAPLQVHQDKARYPLVKSSLGAVIRDTDPGAIPDDEWRPLRGKSSSGTKKDRKPSISSTAVPEVADDILELLGI